MSLFFYTRQVGGGTGNGPEKNYTDSFNLNKVIRSVQMEDNKLLILLDDMHERSEEVPDINPKNGNVRGKKRERNTYQTEITLWDEDVIRFNNLKNN